MYEGIVPKAGHFTSHYNHHGWVWVLKNTVNTGPLFTAYDSGDGQASSAESSGADITGGTTSNLANSISNSLVTWWAAVPAVLMLVLPRRRRLMPYK